ncbi:MAG: ribosome assembly factor SBDS [Candidatus Bathyarchaeia archaeon]
MSQKYTVVRLVVSGERFELMVKPDPALDYKSGKPVAISQILVSDTIFKDVSKGERASEEKLKKLFGTEDTAKIAETIMVKGELQLTTDQRRRLTDEKRRQIITFISRHCIDPRTNLPHPPTRVEQAMDQIRVSIDPFEDAEAQAKEIIQKLKPIIPIKMEMTSVEVRIPPQYASKAYAALKSYGTLKQVSWQPDGGLVASLEMPAGVYGHFVEKMGNLTRGSVQVKEVR